MSSTQEVGDIFGEGKGPAQAMLRSPTVLIVSVGLWGMNIFFFHLFGIDYKNVFYYDIQQIIKKEQKQKQGVVQSSSSSQESLSSSSSSSSSLDGSFIAAGETELVNLLDTTTSIEQQKQQQQNKDIAATTTTTNNNNNNNTVITWYKLIGFSISLLFLLHFTTHFWIDRLGRSSIGAIFSFYGAVILYIGLPFTSTKWLRNAFYIVMYRTFELFHPRFTTCSSSSSSSTTQQGKKTTKTKTINNKNKNKNNKNKNYYNYLRPIPFVDVFYADAMCSLSKVFFDWGMLGHMAAHYPDPVPPSAHNIIIPSVCAAIPYLIRARQCLVMLYIGSMNNDPKRYQHLANAIKYSTSIWPLLLSAYLKTSTVHERHTDQDILYYYEGMLIFLLFINASYSLYWDIVMDWGMMQDPNLVVQSACGGVVGGGGGGFKKHGGAGGGNDDEDDDEDDDNNGPFNNKKKDDYSRTCHRAFLRPTLRYGTAISTWIVITDCLLRFSWTLRFAHHLFPSNDSFVLFTQFLEVFRRSIWNLLRVEWENIKQRRVISLEQENNNISTTTTKTTTTTTIITNGDDEEEQQYLLPSSLSRSFDSM